MSRVKVSFEISERADKLVKRLRDSGLYGSTKQHVLEEMINRQLVAIVYDGTLDRLKEALND